MAVFTFNEDGTIRYLDEHVPYNPFEEEYDPSRAGVSQGSQEQKEVDFENMSSITTINAFIRSFRDDGIVISKKIVKRYLPKVDASLRDYFLKEVSRLNASITNHSWKF